MKSAIYHLHIPRTAGTYIFSHLSERFLTAIETNQLLPLTDEQNHLLNEIRALHHTEIYERFLRPEALPGEEKKRFMFLSGHYALNPVIDDGEKYEVFSVVRDPYEHIVSSAAFTCRESGIQLTKEYLDLYIRGEFDAVYNAPFCSGVANIQTKMLSCRLVSLAGSGITSPSGDSATNVAFCEEDLNKIGSIKELFDDKRIFSFDDRHKLHEWLERTIKLMFGFSIGRFSNEKVNSSHRFGLYLTHEQKQVIKQRNELDFELYEYANTLS